MVSDERSNERGKEKEEFHGRFHRDDKDRKMENSVVSKVIHANPKIVEKSVKKDRSRKAETGTDKGDEKNNLTRT